MKLHKIKKRNPENDTETMYCINNFLWNKTKVKFLNDNEFLAPKYYAPRHLSGLRSTRQAVKRYRQRHPLKYIKKQHQERKQKEQLEKSLKEKRLTDKVYQFKVMLTYNEYEALWDYLYRDLRNPLEKQRRLKTARQMEIERFRKEAKNENRTRNKR